MKESQWTRISAIAEIISSVAILVTLIYLSLQTQQNTDALLSNSRQELLASEMVFISQNLEYPYLNLFNTIEEFNTLGPEQRAQIFFLSVSLFRTRENFWLQYQNGVLDAATWLSYRSVLLDHIIGNEYIRMRWDSNRGIENGFANGFMQEIDDALKNYRGTLDYRIL